MANETPSRPPPFMANAILNFHFDYVTPSLIDVVADIYLLQGCFDELAKSFQERWTKVHKCDRPGCETCLIIDMESIKVHPLQ